MVKFAILLEILSDVWPWVKRTCAFKGKQRCLLVVDDDTVDANFLQALIRNAGHDAEVVETGEGALALVRQNPERYAIVFCDLRLPALKGWNLIPQLLVIAPRTHVVVVCGLLDDIAELDAPGCYFGCIAKPVTRESVKAAIFKTRL